MRYTYSAVNAAGKKVKGQLNAEDKAAAISLLQEQGLVALKLEGGEGRAEEPTSIWQMELTKNDVHKVKIKKKLLLTMMNQMAIMMRSGVSLSLAMEVLIDSEKDKIIRKILREINDELYTGTPISSAMGKFRAFPEIIVNIVQSGEANGRLDVAFERCALILEKEIAMTGKLKSAAAYPCFLMVLVIFLLIIMNTLVLPNFAGIYTSFGANLPGITVMVMNFSDFLMTKWIFIVIALAALTAVFILTRKNMYKVAFQEDRLFLKIPLIGTLLRQSYIARFCRMMSSLVEAGVSIVQSLEIARDVLPNRYMKEQLTQMIADVKVGSSIHQSMSKYPVFDSLLVSMIRVGEESGMLFESMEKMAELYEQQTEESTKRLSGALEPAMTVIIGVVVGTVAIAIVLPMFGMYDVVAGAGTTSIPEV